MNDDMRVKDGSVANNDIVADNRKWPDADMFAQLSFAADSRSRINYNRHRKLAEKNVISLVVGCGR
jgi:hypothetical protein